MEHILGQRDNREAINMPSLGTLPVIKCSNCGSICFENVYLLRLLSALQSPDGQEHLIPESTFRCVNCRALISGISNGDEKEKENEESKGTQESTENNNSQEDPDKLKLI